MFRARNQHATGTEHSKTRHGSVLLNAHDKSLLVTISQKGTEDMMASMYSLQVSLSGFRLSRKQSMAEILICRPLCELDSLTTEQFMTNQAYLQQYGMFMKLSMAKTIA